MYKNKNKNLATTTLKGKYECKMNVIPKPIVIK